ncbi:HNH endonuclease [bacterium]|nr:HNH endonuclease [bacterium]
MNITINNFNNTNINYKSQHKLETFKYKDLKKIPHLTCACCGKEMITVQDLYGAFRTITLPLRSIIKKGFFKSWEQSKPTWDLLNQLATKYPDKSLDQMLAADEDLQTKLTDTIEQSVYMNPKGFKIKDSKQLHNHVNGLYNNIRSYSRSQLRGSGQVMKRFQAFKPILKDEKLAAFEQLEIYAQKYPKKTLSEIIKMDEIYKHHFIKNRIFRYELKEKSDFHFQNIETMLKKSAPKKTDYIMNLKRCAVDLLAREHDVDSRRLKLKDFYINALKELNCEKLKDKVLNEVEEIPIIYVNKDSFFVDAYNNKFNDYQIIISILSPYEATFEHIIPASQNGPDDISNGLVMCPICNRARKDTHYIDFIKYHPLMPYNTQKQILQISQLILAGKADDYLSLYPIQVAKTLSDYTNGAISPDITSYCKKRIKKADNKIQKGFDEIKKIKEERNQMQAEKAELEKRLQELENGIIAKRAQIKQSNSAISHDLGIKHALEKQIEVKNKS